MTYAYELRTSAKQVTDRSLLSIGLAATALGLAATPAHAATTYDESVSGDLSDGGLSPTSLVFGLGSNQVFGVTGRSIAGGPVDRDYFSFVISPGMVLNAIQALPGTISIGASTVSFVGLQLGSQVTVDPAMATAAPLLGYYHFGTADAGNDILPTIGLGPGAQGFTGPLGAGSYAVWLQETAVGSASYKFDFQVSTAAVPEPATWMMMIVGFGTIGWASRAHRKSAGLTVRLRKNYSL